MGGMEFSLRLFDATTQVHPQNEQMFFELPPGRGATISFEIDDTDRARDLLSRRGVRFRGEPLECTGGKEILSVFEDPYGRPVQLYEARFTADDLSIANLSGTFALDDGVIEEPVLAARMQRPVGVEVDNNVLISSNLRDVRGFAFSVAFYVEDLEPARQFYGRILEIPLLNEDPAGLVFQLDGAVLEFRRFRRGSRPVSAGGYTPDGGGVVVFEVPELDRPRQRVAARGARAMGGPFRVGTAGARGPRSTFHDLDGNAFELWQRPAWSAADAR
jgi:catechol 2,3-dioxygenase-like lactoylglutathione lyase family enzyme